jgi:hypothetical protein
MAFRWPFKKIVSHPPPIDQTVAEIKQVYQNQAFFENFAG